MSLAPSLTQTPPVRSGRSGLIVLWVAQIALAAMFLLAGSSKLLGAPAMVGLFDAIGIGQWFRYLTGLIEVGSALALLVPSLAVFGAWRLWRRWSARSQRISSSLEVRQRCQRSCCSDQQASSGLAGINCSAFQPIVR